MSVLPDVGFDFPWVFFALLVVPLLLWVVCRSDRRSIEIAAAFHTRPAPRWKLVLRLIFASLFFVSVAGVGAQPYALTRDGGDYLLMADVSRSMEARFSCDERSFLGRAKSVMREVLARVPEGRFGIIAFDRLAFPISPMTYDRGYLDEVITNGMFVGMTYQATGTDIGNALSVVARKKSELPSLYGNVDRIVLLSDGYFAGDFDRALAGPLEDLGKADVKVAAVAVGNRGVTPIPAGGSTECSSTFLASEGQRVQIPRRTEVLQHIAEKSGGVFAAEGEIDKIVGFLKSMTAGSAAGAPQRRNISWLFLIPATVGLFGLMALQVDSRFPRVSVRLRPLPGRGTSEGRARREG